MVVESEIHFRASDLGDLSCQKSLTVGNRPGSIYNINRTNPHGHWIWAFLLKPFKAPSSPKVRTGASGIKTNKQT